MADLLGQIQQCPAGKKLVILDAGDLACDPRLGLFVNEFPQLLDEEVRRVNDPGLWILASNRPLEVSHVSQSAKRSVFGHFVAEGLSGAADRNGDGMVELAELLQFVRSGVAGWVSRQSGGAETQTPWLLHGGEGAADAPPGLTLLPISERATKAMASREGTIAGRRRRQARRARSKPPIHRTKPRSKWPSSWKRRGGSATEIEQPFTGGARDARSTMRPICGAPIRSCCWATSAAIAAAANMIRRNWPTTCERISCRRQV